MHYIFTLGSLQNLSLQFSHNIVINVKMCYINILTLCTTNAQYKSADNSHLMHLMLQFSARNSAYRDGCLLRCYVFDVLSSRSSRQTAIWQTSGLLGHRSGHVHPVSENQLFFVFIYLDWSVYLTSICHCV